MVGIELVRDRRTRASFQTQQRVAVRVIQEARKRGAIIRPLGDVLVLMPPLTMTTEELQMLLQIIYDSIRTVSEEL